MQKWPARIKSVPRDQYCTSGAQMLDGLLGWLDAISVDIERYVRFGNRQNAVLAGKRATNEEALAWIKTRLEDIAATLVGISLHQTPKIR